MASGYTQHVAGFISTKILISVPRPSGDDADKEAGSSMWAARLDLAVIVSTACQATSGGAIQGGGGASPIDILANLASRLRLRDSQSENKFGSTSFDYHGHTVTGTRWERIRGR